MNFTQLQQVILRRVFIAQALRVLTILVISTALFVVGCRTVDGLLGLLYPSVEIWTVRDGRAAWVTSALLMLGLEMIFFMHIPVAALELGGVREIFKRANNLMAGRRDTILRVLVLLSMLIGSGQIGAASGEEAISLALLNAIYITAWVVITTVCYAELVGGPAPVREGRTGQRQLRAFGVLREVGAICWRNRWVFVLVGCGLLVVVAAVNVTISGLWPLTENTPQAAFFVVQMVFWIEAMRISLVNITVRALKGERVKPGAVFGLVTGAWHSRHIWTVVGVGLVKDAMLFLGVCVPTIVVLMIEPSREIQLFVVAVATVIFHVVSVRLFVAIPVAVLNSGSSAWGAVSAGSKLTIGLRWAVWRVIALMQVVIGVVVAVAAIVMAFCLPSELVRPGVEVVTTTVGALLYGILTTVAHERLRAA
ncbi:MAG: hypothetical protein OXQ29_01195 [Rhodospirillaceae bacterium]|nr:hypothetical protein [Rhodospirillaceae bacterium]